MWIIISSVTWLYNTLNCIFIQLMGLNVNDKGRDIFLSHNSRNKDFVRDLAADIEAVVYTDRTLLTWLDEAEIAPGKSITGLVNEGLENSRFFAIVMTPDYFESGSGWTDAEWHSALFNDPDNRGNRIIPILASPCPYIPPLLKHLRYIDLHEKNYKRGFNELIDILTNKPLPRPKRVRGQMVKPDGRLDASTLIAERAIPLSEPDAINEKLFTNLFRILSIPKNIYFGSVKQKYCKQRRDGSFAMPSKQELKDAIREYQELVQAENAYMPVFRLYEGNIVTFHDLDEPKSWLKPFVEEGSISTEQTTDLLGNDDTYRIVISLFNMALSRHLYRRGLIVDQNRHARFFFPTNLGGINTIEYRSFRKKGSRDVAKPIKADDKVVSWIHQGAFIKLIALGKQLFVQINPTWVLTSDGKNPMGGKDVAKTINRWQNAERNAAVLRHNKFWTSMLSQGKKFMKIYAGDQILVVDANPAVVKMPVGILNDQTSSFKDDEEITVDDIIAGKLYEVDPDEYYGDYDDEYLEEDDIEDFEFEDLEDLEEDED